MEAILNILKENALGKKLFESVENRRLRESK
jgi:hypothetical protein